MYNVGMMTISCYLRILLVCGLVATAFSANADILPGRPHEARNAASTGTLFEELDPASTGIDFVQPIDTDHPQKCLYVGGYASPGLALGDLNGDGLVDLAVTGGPVRNRIYLQVARAGGGPSLRFEDVSATCGLKLSDVWSAGVTLVDIDSDGDLDIYICNYDAPNELYINRSSAAGKLALVESAEAFGLDLVDASFVSTFADYDRDGDLDVLVGCYQYVNAEGRPADPPVRKRGDTYEVLPEFQKYYGIVRAANGQQTFTNVGRANYLLRSNASEVGDEPIRFSNVTESVGIRGKGVANSLLWWDFDSDGWLDIFVGNDFKVPDQLYRNNGDGTFTDVIRIAFPHTTWFSMGSDVGDVNNDGRLDLLVSDMAGTTHYRSKVTMGEMNVHREFLKTAEPRQYMRNALLLNTGTRRFQEAAYMAGLAKSDWSWAVKLADFDNDGWTDAFISNGAARMFNHADRNFTDRQRIGKTQWELWEDTPPRLEENLAFRNLGDLKFEKVGAKWGLKKNGMSYSAATGDLDNDGDLDLVVGNLDAPLGIYRNTSVSHSITVRLAGDDGNLQGLGALVKVRSGESLQTRQLMPATGFLSSNQPLLHFGLGDREMVDSLSIRWPNGTEQELQDLPADRAYVIDQPAAGGPEKTQLPDGAIARRLFVPSRVFPALKHVENEFDDYQRQPLLPYAHSRLGPGLAMADIDGDADLDFYCGRARGARRAVYENRRKGQLGVKGILKDDSHEDMGAIFFDADSDGDQDLYVVSGGVECDANDHSLRDRLYLNEGEGGFRRDERVLPNLRDSGSVVCAADYDRDGDLDLFVGSRVIPGQYPAAPRSRLLENVSADGKAGFRDVTSMIADEVGSAGLVTGAIWSDADGDGWIDLLVTVEWGPVRLFRNELVDGRRQLIERTVEAGLDIRRGWWNGIAARDMDHDGDIDYVVTNFGLNTKYKASDEKPELMFFGKFDETGKYRILEAAFEAGKCFPRRGLSCSSHAMPFVRSKVRTFHKFGLSTLQEIYTEEKLEQSLQLSANCLESGLLLNESHPGELPTFRFQPLARTAQIAPAFGVVTGDFNADGNVDLFLAQNFYSPQVETGANGWWAGAGVDGRRNQRRRKCASTCRWSARERYSDSG